LDATGDHAHPSFILKEELPISAPAQTNPSIPARSFLPRIRRPKNIALALIFMTMLIDVMGITILFPVSAYIVRSYSDQAMMFILVNVIYSAAQFFAAPVLGNLSDRIGRRPVLLVCLFGSGIGYLMFGIGGALWVLFLARLIAGITGGSLSTASAYIVDVSAPGEVGKNLTLVGMAWGVGLVLGPALGGALGQLNLSAPAFAAAAFALLNLALAIFWLPESLPKERRKVSPFRPSDFNALISIRDIGRLPGLALLLVVLTIFNFAFNEMLSTESLFIIHKFDALPLQMGILSMASGISSALVQALLLPRLLRRFGEKTIALVCLGILALGAVAIPTNPIFSLTYGIVILRGAASGFIFPILSILNVSRVSPQDQGALMGVTTALGSLAAIFSSLLAGVIYDAWSPGSPYWVAAALFVAAIFTLRADHYSRDPQQVLAG
jgi:DHA1 family tetracycline resistance protein-like MFS transporter